MKEKPRKYFVPGEEGGWFGSLEEAKEYAQLLSVLQDYAIILEHTTKTWLYEYSHGKCVYAWGRGRKPKPYTKEDTEK